MNEKYEIGRCDCCLKESEVRWKNIYHSGSEGTWVCIKCELKIVSFVRSMRTKSFLDRKQKYIDKKIKLVKREELICFLAKNKTGKSKIK